VALSKTARAKIPTHQFALPAQRKYPINTRKRAGKALGLVALNGTPAQKQQVRAAVQRAYPTMVGAPAAASAPKPKATPTIAVKRPMRRGK
jgi:hypothetical protein